MLVSLELQSGARSRENIPARIPRLFLSRESRHLSDLPNDFVTAGFSFSPLHTGKSQHCTRKRFDVCWLGVVFLRAGKGKLPDMLLVSSSFPHCQPLPASRQPKHLVVNFAGFFLCGRDADVEELDRVASRSNPSLKGRPGTSQRHGLERDLS